MATNQKLEIELKNISKDMSKRGIKYSFLDKLQNTLAKDQYTATDNDNFLALSLAIRDRITERWIATQQRYHKENVKRVYYLSLEFLIGRLLGTNVMNLGLEKEVKEAMEELDFDLETLRECESDAGLGNGGLGRLAACFLDSMATMGIPAQGYGIRYEYGIFNQKIINGFQVEFPDEWLRKGYPWEILREEYSTRIQFYGKTHMFNDSKGRLRVKWVDSEDIFATPYDIPVVGCGNDVVNNLRLWAARSSEEFDLKYFNDGDYEQAVFNKVNSEIISKVLYPNDSLVRGKELRLKQEYFFTAASIADIIRRFKEGNDSFKNFADKNAIQLNDTHPAVAIPELMRLLIDEENLDWDTAWDICVNTFGYTNHTVMPEALELWPLPLFEKLLPRHMQIIYEINRRFMEEVSVAFPGDNDRLRRMSLIEEGGVKQIRMAHLAIVGSHSVNGVSKLHSDILKSSLFRDFYGIWPEKFNNKTNGITQRRWLWKTNPGLSDLIDEAIGNKWVVDYREYKKLLPFKEDNSFCERWSKIKYANKKHLSDYIFHTTGISVNPDSMFDVQIKRIHEYKRQLLFGLYIITQYLKARHDPNVYFTPRTFIVAGKSAPGYFMAKRIIKFLTSISAFINKDKRVNDLMKVVFLENYRVSLAEKIFPASDLSEQISLAGTEASGTGCMKFMMNGALTIGTLDGANIEIANAVGKENMFLFGLTVKEVMDLRAKGYQPKDQIENLPLLKEAIALIESNFFSPVDHDLFKPLLDSITYQDPYCICADFESYCSTQDIVSWAYGNKKEWTQKSIVNVASSGIFSSDRTIKEYAEGIWGISPKFYEFKTD
jgi:starch phosphorylase